MPKKVTSLGTTATNKAKAHIAVELRQKYPLALLLSLLQLARSSFYYHVKRVCTDKYSDLKQQIQHIYHKHKGRYGYRRITLALRYQGQLVNHKTVLRIMREMGLQSIVRRKKYTSYRGRPGRIAKNILKRNFTSNKPCEKWVTDVTEFKVGESKLYLSPLIDLYNGEVVNYELARRPVFALVKKMLVKALKKVKSKHTLTIHSDQGWHYQMKEYQRLLSDKAIKQSMSRKGNCLDNAVAESFFAVLKTECFYTKKFTTIEELEKEIHEYIGYYNNHRGKLRLKGLSPVQYRTQALLT